MDGAEARLLARAMVDIGARLGRPGGPGHRWASRRAVDNAREVAEAMATLRGG